MALAGMRLWWVLGTEAIRAAGAMRRLVDCYAVTYCALIRI